MTGTRAFHHAARAIAYAAKGETENAARSKRFFSKKRSSCRKKKSLATITAEDILALAARMIEGEILIREDKLDAGIAELREAIKLEDALKYDEPPGWLIPVRHSLGATLMQNGRFAEAEQVYRDDLKRLPDNGWSFTVWRAVCARKRRTPMKQQRRTQNSKNSGPKPTPKSPVPVSASQ